MKSCSQEGKISTLVLENEFRRKDKKSFPQSEGWGLSGTSASLASVAKSTESEFVMFNMNNCFEILNGEGIY